MHLYKATPTLLLAALLSAVPALARTDLEGCVSTEVIVQRYASYIWYVPDTGEICSFPDCGGGRAPPKTTQPGCGGYEGTETVTPSYWPGFRASTGTTAAPTTVAATGVSQSTADTGETGEIGASNTGSAAPTESSSPSITTAPKATISGGAVTTSTMSSSSKSSAGSSGSLQTSVSTSSISTAAASCHTAVSRNMMGFMAGVVGGFAIL